MSGGVSPDKPPGAAHSDPYDGGAPRHWAVGHPLTQSGKGGSTNIFIFSLIVYIKLLKRLEMKQCIDLNGSIYFALFYFEYNLLHLELPF